MARQGAPRTFADVLDGLRFGAKFAATEVGGREREGVVVRCTDGEVWGWVRAPGNDRDDGELLPLRAQNWADIDEAPEAAGQLWCESALARAFARSGAALLGLKEVALSLTTQVPPGTAPGLSAVLSPEAVGSAKHVLEHTRARACAAQWEVVAEGDDAVARSVAYRSRLVHAARAAGRHVFTTDVLLHRRSQMCVGATFLERCLCKVDAPIAAGGGAGVRHACYLYSCVGDPAGGPTARRRHAACSNHAMSLVLAEEAAVEGMNIGVIARPQLQMFIP